MKKVKQLQQRPEGLEAFFRHSPHERNWEKFRQYPDYKNAQGETAYEELRTALVRTQKMFGMKKTTPIGVERE